MNHPGIRADDQVEGLNDGGRVQPTFAKVFSAAGQVDNSQLFAVLGYLLKSRAPLQSDQTNTRHGSHRAEVRQRHGAEAVTAEFAVSLPANPHLKAWNAVQTSAQRSVRAGSAVR